jgi:hypothetical protein
VGHPWSGPRHRSWASDTVIFAVIFVVVLGITAVSDYLNGSADPPAYLVGLCGAAGSALFGFASSDKNKRDKEVSATAIRAEAKADDALVHSHDVVLGHVLDIQERELAANRAALQLMHDAVQVKELNGIPVLPETHVAMAQLQRQVDLLDAEIQSRRAQLGTEFRTTQERQTAVENTANRAEAKADDAIARSLASQQRESGWSQHRDHHEHPDAEGGAQ